MVFRLLSPAGTVIPVLDQYEANPVTDQIYLLAYFTTDLAETPGRATEDLVGDHQGGPRASWRTPGLWPTSLEPRVAIDLY